MDPRAHVDGLNVLEGVIEGEQASEEAVRQLQALEIHCW